MGRGNNRHESRGRGDRREPRTTGGGGFRSDFVSDFSREFSGGGGGFHNQGPREMHKAKCADCGQECDVPFKPIEGRPVYCRQCYPKHKRI